MRTRTNPTDPSASTPTCWQREAPSACLRVELADGAQHLFTYNHFVTASLTRNVAGEETVQVSFSTHDLRIDGRGLRDLLLGLQDFAVKWLRTRPDRYQTLASETSGFISTITISASD